MKRRMGKRGQTALETAFVVLFIVVAVWGVSVKTMRYGGDIEAMSRARALAQGAALELSMEGTTTHLIRIDEVIVEGNLRAKLYARSEDCGEAEGRMEQRIEASLGEGFVASIVCEEGLYEH